MTQISWLSASSWLNFVLFLWRFIIRIISMSFCALWKPHKNSLRLVGEKKRKNSHYLAINCAKFMHAFQF
jgi:hypothetical protein